MTESGQLSAQYPTLQDAHDLIRTAIDSELFLTVFGRCRVEYDGRASSILEAGDRLVILKPDGTVLVHTDEGHQPVNWQPPGCTHEVSITEELHIRSAREQPAETLEIHFESVSSLVGVDATDEHELSLHGTEADMRERILSNPDLVEPGFEPRATERETTAGAVDIYGVDSEDRSVVVELKRRRVGPDAVSQLNRYVSALERELHAETTVRGVLVAPSVTDRATYLLERHGLGFVSLTPTPDS